MGITSRSQRSMNRKRVKQAKKSAKAALYKSYSERGRTSGSKRSQRTKDLYKPTKGRHAQKPCGNPACRKCYVTTGSVMVDVARVI